MRGCVFPLLAGRAVSRSCTHARAPTQHTRVDSATRSSNCCGRPQLGCALLVTIPPILQAWHAFAVAMNCVLLWLCLLVRRRNLDELAKVASDCGAVDHVQASSRSPPQDIHRILTFIFYAPSSANLLSDALHTRMAHALACSGLARSTHV